jgi:hypothetical protein
MRTRTKRTVRVLVIWTTGGPQSRLIENTLGSMSTLLGGHLEMFSIGAPLFLVVNADGPVLGLAPNPSASKVAGRPIVGVAFVTAGRGQESRDLTDDEVASMTAKMC